MNSNGFVYSNMNLHDFFGTQIIPTNHKNVTINELLSTNHEFLDARKNYHGIPSNTSQMANKIGECKFFLFSRFMRNAMKR